MTTRHSLASQAPSEYLEHFSADQSAYEKSLSSCKINKSTTNYFPWSVLLPAKKVMSKY